MARHLNIILPLINHSQILVTARRRSVFLDHSLDFCPFFQQISIRRAALIGAGAGQAGRRTKGGGAGPAVIWLSPGVPPRAARAPQALPATEMT
ncbi:MAG: hypothetical protein LW715_09245 [Rhodobacter sp.]|nr:hypothetical protein [Rhodobacter sp.]